MDEGPTTLPQSAPLAEDLPCLRCHYNLRTLAPSAKCPECAAPVADSIEFHRRFGGIDLPRLQHASAFFAACALLAGLWTGWLAPYLYNAWGRRIPERAWEGVSLGATAALTALLIAGILCFRKILVPRHPARAALVGLLAILIASMEPCISAAEIVLRLAANPNDHLVIESLLGGCTVLRLLGDAAIFVVACLLLRRAARRIERPWLATMGALALLPSAAFSFIHAIDFGILLLTVMCRWFHWPQAWASRFSNWLRFIYSLEPASSLRWQCLLLAALAWLIILFTARSARRGIHPASPAGLLIDPPHATPPAPSLEAFFPATLRAAALLLVLTPAFGFASVLFDRTLPTARLFGMFVAPFLAVTFVILIAVTVLLTAQSRRRPLLRHRLRARTAIALALVALLLQFAMLFPATQTLRLYWQPPDELMVPQVWLACIMLLAARAFMINTARAAGLPRLARQIRILSGIAVGLALFAPMSVPLVLGNDWVGPEAPFKVESAFLAFALLLLSACGALFWLGIRRLGAHP